MPVVAESNGSGKRDRALDKLGIGGRDESHGDGALADRLIEYVACGGQMRAVATVNNGNGVIARGER